MSINIKSLITTGLLMGLIINISAIAMVPIVGNQFDNVLAARQLPPLSVADMIFFSGLSFFFGFFLLWLYAVAKVQFGAGVKTALKVGTLLWIVAYLIPNIANVIYGFMPGSLTIIGTAWGLVELLTASLVGARLYKDRIK